MYRGLGLEVTSRWINLEAMKGAVLIHQYRKQNIRKPEHILDLDEVTNKHGKCIHLQFEHCKNYKLTCHGKSRSLEWPLFRIVHP